MPGRDPAHAARLFDWVFRSEKSYGVCLECGAEIYFDETVNHFAVEHANLDYEHGAVLAQPKEGSD